MTDRPEGLVEGVNKREEWAYPELGKPSVSENKQEREVLLVDPRGAALLVRQPRPVGFRKP